MAAPAISALASQLQVCTHSGTRPGLACWMSVGMTSHGVWGNGQNRNALADSGALDVMLALAQPPQQPASRAPQGSSGSSPVSPRRREDSLKIRLESWQSILEARAREP